MKSKDLARKLLSKLRRTPDATPAETLVGAVLTVTLPVMPTRGTIA